MKSNAGHRRPANLTNSRDEFISKFLLKNLKDYWYIRGDPKATRFLLRFTICRSIRLSFLQWQVETIKSYHWPLPDGLNHPFLLPLSPRTAILYNITTREWSRIYPPLVLIFVFLFRSFLRVASSCLTFLWMPAVTFSISIHICFSCLIYTWHFRVLSVPRL